MNDILAGKPASKPPAKPAAKNGGNVPKKTVQRKPQKQTRTNKENNTPFAPESLGKPSKFIWFYFRIYFNVKFHSFNYFPTFN